MASLLTDLDATCANLGYHETDRYYAEPDALQNLKHLIWILRRDSETHDYRRHLGRAKVLQTDLLPMLVSYSKDIELSDVLLRLLVNLTNPALLLYREELPTDGPGRKLYLEIIEHLQGYKAAFASEDAWTVLCVRLQEALDIDWAERSEDQGLLIERILVLARNVLQVPANPDNEKRADNDASLHDQVLWGLHQSGMLDIVLFITNTQQENQYHLHAIEIISLMYREQNVGVLASSELHRSSSEKENDEKELVAARRREQAKAKAGIMVGEFRMPPSARHSRFGGTYVLQNVKSISDNDMICHKVVSGPEELNLNKEKTRHKKPKNKIVVDVGTGERRSAFSVRLFLREFCLEFLASSYNTVMKDVRRVVTSTASVPDESYLLWAVRFFMEFNRLNGFRLDYISETLSTSWFHWVLSCSDKCMEMAVMDKKRIKLWARRLHLAVQAYREFLLSMQSLVKLPSEEAKALALSLQGNVFYVIEYRETVIHLLLHYDPAKNSKTYLKDLIETAHIFSRMLEKYCKTHGIGGAVVVQQARKKKKAKTKKSVPAEKPARISQEDRWLEIASQITAVLTSDGAAIPTDIVPFDVTSDIEIDQQKEECMRRIQRLLREESFEEAIGLLRSAREVWPEHDFFGAANIPPEEEQMVLNEIFVAEIGNKVPTNEEHQETEEESEDENSEEEGPQMMEANFKFSDFESRLCNPKVVRACTLLLSSAPDGNLPTRAVVSACSILHRIAWSCKCSGMLFQASLFRVFQAALNAPVGTVHEELRKLAVFIVRQFTKAAATNKKVFAELLFWKSMREVLALENNYELDPDAFKKGKASAWSEEEEMELRRLFEENQSNPQNEQDVIDWLVENLVNLRTRREVIKKLRELDLKFTKPTRKQTAQGAKRNWTPEQDQLLTNLYGELRANDDVLARICEAIPEKVEANILRRMITLGLIADKKEVKPSKRKSRVNDDGSIKLPKPRAKKDGTGKKKQKSSAPKRVVTVTKLNRAKISSIMHQLEEHDEAIQWLIESFTDAIEDLSEQETVGDEEGIPLVPFVASQREALDKPAFMDLLRELGVQPPIDEQENYWRIPGKFNVQEVKTRVAILEDPHANVEENMEEETEDQTQIEEPLALSEDEDDDNSDGQESDDSVDYMDVLEKRKEHQFSKSRNDDLLYKESAREYQENVTASGSTDKDESLITKKKKSRRIDRTLMNQDDIEDYLEETSPNSSWADVGLSESLPKKNKSKRGNIFSDSEEDMETTEDASTSTDASKKKKSNKFDRNEFLKDDENSQDITTTTNEISSIADQSEMDTTMQNNSGKNDSLGKMFEELVDSDDEIETSAKRPRSESSEDEATSNVKRSKTKTRRIISDDEDE